MISYNKKIYNDKTFWDYNFKGSHGELRLSEFKKLLKKYEIKEIKEVKKDMNNIELLKNKIGKIKRDREVFIKEMIQIYKQDPLIVLFQRIERDFLNYIKKITNISKKQIKIMKRLLFSSEKIYYRKNYDNEVDIIMYPSEKWNEIKDVLVLVKNFIPDFIQNHYKNELIKLNDPGKIIICEKCGTENKTEANYCNNCGKEL